jgi:FkbM family methyltransferase
MGILTPLYKLALSVRHGPLGEGLAKAWHKTAPNIHVWKRVYGVDVCMDFRDSLYMWAMDPRKIEEGEGYDWILKGIKGTVWDVGCNVGILSLYAASQGNRVVAFDISSKATSLLDKSAKRGGFPITTIPRAFSVEPFKYTPPQDADTRNRPGATIGAQATVTSMTYLEAEAQFGLPRFIKLDIEHAETEFLKSDKFRAWIKENKITLLMELHSKEYWNMVWPDVAHCEADEGHVLFNPQPEFSPKSK